MSRRALVAALSLFLAACGGGGHSTAPASLPGSVPASRSMSSGTLTLTIPAPAATTSARSRASISSATQSVGIVINGAAPVLFNVTPTSAGCAAVAGATKCTLTLGAPVGIDAFAISTYSGLNGTGAVLDTATMTFTIAASVAFALSVNLGPVVSTTADSGPGSLRAAIAQANPGDTITFLPGVTGTIALTGGAITLAQNVTLGGPGAANLTISGGNNSQIFVVNAGVTAAISGLTLTRGKGVEGGAIASIAGATLSVSNCTFTANTAQYGGAIGSESANTTVANSTFTGNTAIGPTSSDLPYGGAIYSDNDITITGSTFTANVSGGGAAAVNYGGAIVEDGFSTTGLTLSNSQFTSNKAGVPANGDVSGVGGAIYDDSGDTMTLSGNTFGGGSGLGNVASGASDSYGGAIAADTATNASLATGNTFSYNAVTSVVTSTGGYSGGGAIWLSQDNTLTLAGTNAFANNSVTAGPNATVGGEADGGAIDMAYGGVITLPAGTTFSNNAVIVTDALGNAYGGAIKYIGDSNGCCSVSRRAGQAFHGRHTALARRRTLQSGSNTMTGVTFTSNTATGGVSSIYGVLGGAIDVESNVTMTISNSTFTSNTASAGLLGFRGAISGVGGTMMLLNDQINNNTASQVGGGVYASTSETLTVTNCTITGNQVTNENHGAQGGGGIGGGVSTVTISGTTIAGNSVSGATAGSGGGGVQTWSNVPVTMTIVNSTIANNTSGIDGGGIENLDSYILNLINVTMYGNSANSGTGGNINNTAVATIQNTIFAGGSASTGADVDNIAGGTLTSSGNNWIQTAVVGAFGPLGSDHVNAGSPQLAAGPANNGGPTLTIADFMTSPVRHAIPFAGGVCGTSGPATDQRGNARGAGGYCDIGAYEFP